MFLDLFFWTTNNLFKKINYINIILYIIINMKKALITITQSATQQFNNILKSNARYKGFLFWNKKWWL